MKEYEYSFKVESIQPIIKYCVNNGYEQKYVSKQNRIVYETKNNSHIIARLTTENVNNTTSTYFDFKNVDNKNENFKISNESIALKVTDENMEAIKSILNVLEFYEVANNFRTRYVYQKNGVIFEIDDYSKPKMKVVAIEGIDEEVEIVCNELKQNKILN